MASVESNTFYEAINRTLQRAADLLSSSEEKERMHARSRLHVDPLIYFNQDGTIDAELRISKIPPGLTVNTIMTAIERNLDDVWGTFVQTGVRYRPMHGEPVYTRFMGMTQAESFYHRFLKDALGTGKDIETNMKRRGRGKPEQVFVRFNWNPEGTKPPERWPGAGKSPHHPKRR